MGILCMPECSREELEPINARLVVEISCKVRASDMEQAREIMKIALDEVVELSKLKNNLPKDDEWCSEWDYNEQMEEW